ncbi:MAG: LPS assembly protein LptD, partial [Verrucomicrobiota bacterium]
NNPQPNTFVEVNKFWQNFSLDVLAQPRLNNFYETVERLPDVRLSGFRQELGTSPFYYETESTAGYYRRLFAETNNAPPDLNFEAARADTYHQITLPQTFFGWLNFIPRAGGRFTYYSEATGPGASTDEVYRGVFNTGAEVNFKASALWPAVQSHALDLDGLRHIVEPSANYVYVPSPTDRPADLPQFDYELPSLALLPLDFPEYNSIDSVDSENVIRFGLRNKLQTKRNGQVEDVLDMNVQLDWRLRPRSDANPDLEQKTFGDLYTDLTLRPRNWLILQSQTRFDINNETSRLLLHTVTIQPNDVWSWTLGHFYLRDQFNSSPTALGQGNELITSSFYYRMNENWGFRASHRYDLRQHRMREQYYTFYRDLRSWTCALTLGLRDNTGEADDYLVAFTFSLKAAPRFGLGSDTVEHSSLLGR